LLAPKYSIKYSNEYYGWVFKGRTNCGEWMHFEQPMRSFQLRVLIQTISYSVEEFHDAVEKSETNANLDCNALPHPASRQLAWWGLDQFRDGGESVGHFVSEPYCR
jgi:hypothetical protein